MLEDLLEELLKEAYRRYQAQQRGGGKAERRAAGPVFPPTVGPDPWATWKQKPRLEGSEKAGQPAAEEGTPFKGEALSSEGVSGVPDGAETRTDSLAATPPSSAAADHSHAAFSAGPIPPREGMKWSLIFSPPRCLDPYRPPGWARRFGR